MTYLYLYKSRVMSAEMKFMKRTVKDMWETKPGTTVKKISRLLMWPEHVTRRKTLQAIELLLLLLLLLLLSLLHVSFLVSPIR
jgi:hypothetical protein